jgi:hypothetical protein
VVEEAKGSDIDIVQGHDLSLTFEHRGAEGCFEEWGVVRGDVVEDDELGGLGANEKYDE